MTTIGSPDDPGTSDASDGLTTSLIEDGRNGPGIRRGGNAGAPIEELLRSAGLADLVYNPPIGTVEAVLRQLSELVDGADRLRLATLREETCRRLRSAGLRSCAAMADAALGSVEEHEDASGQGHALTLKDPEPWSDPVDGAALLDELADAYGAYLSQPEEAAVAEALWTVHAHAHEAAQVSPILAFTSPSKRCGKTTALTVAGALVPRALTTSNVTPAALYRSIEKYCPTLLVDEVDSFLADREQLRGVLNSGHSRAAAYVARCVEPDYEPRLFRTWGPKAVALIGRLPDTLADRSIEIPMRRRRASECVRQLRLDRLGPELEHVSRRAARWAADHLDALKAADPEVPAELNDRAADNWRPLLAIADAAGGDWTARARSAARFLSGDATGDTDVQVQLLADVREIFGDGVRMGSSDLVDALAKMEERPWPEWKRGKPITPRQLARLVGPYGIRPKKLRDGSKTFRGYERVDFEDAWERYLPPAHPVNPERSEQSHKGVEDWASTDPERGGDVTDRESAGSSRGAGNVPDVPDVLDRNPGPGWVDPDAGPGGLV